MEGGKALAEVDPIEAEAGAILVASSMLVCKANLAAPEEGTSSASQGESKRKNQEDNSFGNFAHFAYTDEGNVANASISTHKSCPDWILDSGASKHVTGNSKEFESYIQHPPTHNETIQTADGTSQTYKGTWKCSVHSCH